MIKKLFIEKLVKKLNDVNESRAYDGKSLLDVCFMVSVVDQNIKACKEFIEDISKYNYDINRYEEDTSGGYTNGKVRIFIEKPEEEKESEYLIDAYYDYYYEIEFTNDERYWGYCDCTFNDKDYNEKYKCCGHGCDWVAPSFRLEKVESIGHGTWAGYESDYWKYEEMFNKTEKLKSDEVEKYKKEQQIKYLEEQIAELQNKLNETKNG